MRYFPGTGRCDPELAAPANRRALTEDDLTQIVDDAAGFAGQSAASAAHAEEVVAGIDGAVGEADAAATIATGAATEAVEAKNAAVESEANSGENANRAQGSAEAAEVAAASVQKGQPNGTAPLDGGAKLPEVNLPDRLSEQELQRTFVSAVIVPSLLAGASNCTAAVQALIDAAPVGADIRFPAGTFNLDGLTITKRLRISGAGNQATTLNMRTTSAASVMLDINFAGENPVVRDLGIRLNNALNAIGVRVTGAHHGMFDDLYITGGSIGVHFYSGGASILNRGVISNQTAAGVLINGDLGTEYKLRAPHIYRDTAGTTQALVKVKRTTGNDTGGIYFEDVLLVRAAGTTLAGFDIECDVPNTVMPIFFTGCVSDNHDGGYAARVKNVVDVMVAGSWFSGAAGAPGSILIDGGRNFTASASRFHSVSGPAVTFAGSHVGSSFFGNIYSGTCAFSLPSGGAPTKLFHAGDILVGTTPLTDDFGRLSASGNGNNEVSPLTVLTRGDGGAAQAFALGNSEDSNRRKKFLRVLADGTLQILNNAFSSAVATLTDAGLLTTTGGLATTGKLRLYGAGPAVVAASGAGLNPPGPGVLRGSDSGGTIRWGTGTGATGTAQVTVTFATPFANPPTVQITPGNALTAQLGVHPINVSTTGFIIALATNPAASLGATDLSAVYSVVATS